MLSLRQDLPIKACYFLTHLKSGRKQFGCVFLFLTIMKPMRHEACSLSQNNELVK